MSFPLCEEINGLVPQVSDVDYFPPAPAQSALLSSPDSSQDLCPGCPGTCPTGGSQMTGNAWRGQAEITVHSARQTPCPVCPCFGVPPYCYAPRGQCCLCSLSGPQPHATYGGCSSVSGNPSDISRYFLPTLRRSRVALQSFTFLQV